MRSTIPAIALRLGAAHWMLALAALLAVGWLQSDFAERPWWQGQLERLGPLADCVVAWRFVAVGYLLLTVLVEWRLGVALRGASNWPRATALLVLAWHLLVFAAVAAAIARGPVSRALLADLDEWVAVVGVVSLLAIALQVAGLLLARTPWRLPSEPAARMSPPTRGLTVVTWALGVAALCFVIATVALETRSLPHVETSQS